MFLLRHTQCTVQFAQKWIAADRASLNSADISDILFALFLDACITEWECDVEGLSLRIPGSSSNGFDAVQL